MQFFRNPEIKRLGLIYVILTLIVSLIGLYFDVAFGIMLLCVCIVFSSISLIFTYKRYKKISKLGFEIDGVLHGEENYSFSKFAEGELAILQNELSKMLVRLREQAESLKKDKVFLSDTIADISHQIRTPLTSVNLIMTRLSADDLTCDERMELICQANELLGKIDWLITSFLKISKLDASTANLRKQTVSVEELVEKSSEIIIIPMELREQNLKISVDENTSFVGDLLWSIEAIGNILKNCMEHTPNGGTIEIDANENAIYTEIIISDNGSGFDLDDLPHIFERFYKGKNSSVNSFGIGLALANMIAAEQNGTIKAENSADGGAVFTIRFYKSVV